MKAERKNLDSDSFQSKLFLLPIEGYIPPIMTLLYPSNMLLICRDSREWAYRSFEDILEAWGGARKVGVWTTIGRSYVEWVTDSGGVGIAVDTDW